MSVSRREFLAGGAGVLAPGGQPAILASARKTDSGCSEQTFDGALNQHSRRRFKGAQLDNIKFPLGGIGAGMICLEGAGSISSVSIRSRPELLNEPCLFATVNVLGAGTRILEGPIPRHKILHQRLSGEGGAGMTYGFPRYAEAEFTAEFPFAEVRLSDEAMPIAARIVGWSPFEPLDADNSSLPFAALEYELTNTAEVASEGLFAFHARNFIADQLLTAEKDGRHGIRKLDNGVAVWAEGSSDGNHLGGALAVEIDHPDVKAGGWWRGGTVDSLRMVWRGAQGDTLARFGLGTDEKPAPGASLFVPLRLEPGKSRIVRVRIAWHAPESRLRAGDDPANALQTKDYHGFETYRPWYMSRFANIDESSAAWRNRYDELRSRAVRFKDCLFSTSLPAEVLEAVAANLSIFKSPTMLRQVDGRFWGWEGVDEEGGNGFGSCTHVWNYAQAMAHLFPTLERTMRESETHELLDADGHQNCRLPLPIRKPVRTSEQFEQMSFSSATPDGQLGSIVRTFRDWRISGDTVWLRSLWPKLRASLDFCIRTWDPHRRGWLERPRLNTYDILFWQPDIRDSSLYLAALQAITLMANALGEECADYARLLKSSAERLNTQLFNGEYFQQLPWAPHDIDAQDADTLRKSTDTPEGLAVINREGPPYQYGRGCMTDGLVGEWLAQLCGIGPLLDPEKVRKHLAAVFRHNFRATLADHVNPGRPKYALGREAGTLLCTWPRGGEPSFPFTYSTEVWSGLEYEAASHLIMAGMVEEGLTLVRACRARHDGTVRNPFDDFEAGRWYARSMACYALLQALSGVRLDRINGTLYLHPAWVGDFQAFFCTASGYGLVGVKDGRPFVDVVSGTIPYDRIDYRQAIRT